MFKYVIKAFTVLVGAIMIGFVTSLYLSPFWVVISMIVTLVAFGFAIYIDHKEDILRATVQKK